MPNRFIEPLILSVLAIVFCISVFSLTRVRSASNVSSVSNRASAEKDLPDGVAHEVEIIAGPFDLHRKYRSMEGPYANATFKVSDLLGARQLTVDETAVRFVENGEHASMVPGGDPAASANVPAKSGAPRELVWAKGVKLLVLDEQDRPLPTAEFICHFNVDVEPRAAVFPEVQTGSLRLFTLTQGQTDFHFPVGYGVPLASDESIHIKFQAANRTTTAHRRLKHVCTLELIKDSNLKAPMKALSWYTPFMAVEINGAETPVAPTIHGQNCLALSSGENAPNAIPGSVVDYARGRKVTGHWRVPPGEHLYTCPLTADRDYKLSDEDRIVRAVWTHVHPLCKEATMLVCDGNSKTPLWTVHVKTKTKPGLEIEKISDLYFDDGVVLPKGKHLEIDAVYDNSTAETQDSMVSEGVFFEDRKFVKPNWTNQAAASSSAAPDAQCTDRYCGIKPLTTTEVVQPR